MTISIVGAASLVLIMLLEYDLVPASSYPITDRFPPKSKKFSRQACLTLKQRCVFPMEADLQELPEHELLSLPIEEIRGVKRLLEKLVNREAEASVRQE